MEQANNGYESTEQENFKFRHLMVANKKSYCEKNNGVHAVWGKLLSWQGTHCFKIILETVGGRWWSRMANQKPPATYTLRKAL